MTKFAQVVLSFFLAGRDSEKERRATLVARRVGHGLLPRISDAGLVCHVPRHSERVGGSLSCARRS